MVARAHSTLGTQGPPPPCDDDVHGGDFDVEAGDDDVDTDDVGGGEGEDDVDDDDDDDDGESDDQPHSFHLPANSEDSPQPTSHLDSEPDIQPFLS